MRKQLGILSALFTSLFAVCAYIMLAAVLCTLSACKPAGEAPPSASLPAQPEQSTAAPSQEPSLALPADFSPEPSVQSDSNPQPSAPVSEPSAQPSAPEQSGPAASQPPAQLTPQSTQNSFPEIPLDDYSLNLAVPDFLDEDQQLLYRQAHAMYCRMFGANVAISIGDEDKFPDSKDFVEYNGIGYTKAYGQYAAWTDFDAMVHSLFTDRFWTSRNTIQRGERYVNINGALYFLDVSNGGYYRNDYFPDAFTLNSKTDDEIDFTITGYYSSPWLSENETIEERDQRLKNGWDYTLDFNVKLVRTEDGWRFDKFHSTVADQVDPETAALMQKTAAQ